MTNVQHVQFFQRMPTGGTAYTTPTHPAPTETPAHAIRNHLGARILKAFDDHDRIEDTVPAMLDSLETYVAGALADIQAVAWHLQQRIERALERIEDGDSPDDVRAALLGVDVEDLPEFQREVTRCRFDDHPLTEGETCPFGTHPEQP